MLSPVFWNQVEYEFVLFLQDGSVVKTIFFGGGSFSENFLLGFLSMAKFFGVIRK